MPKNKMKKRKETRLVVIDEGKERGILLERWNLEIEESIQDEGRTIKLFIKEKNENNTNKKS